MRAIKCLTLLTAAVLGAGAIALSACSALEPDVSVNNPAANPWVPLLGDTNLPLWSVEPCDSTAPFLCVFDQSGNQAGTVELQTWTIQDRPDLAGALIVAGLDPAAIDPQNPAQQEQVLRALRTMVDEFYTSLEQDWVTGHGDALTFEPYPPVEARVGDRPALLYGYTGIGADGSIQQQSVGYIMFDGEQLYAITTAAPFNEPPGFASIEQLQGFQPYLDRVVSQLQL